MFVGYNPVNSNRVVATFPKANKHNSCVGRVWISSVVMRATPTCNVAQDVSGFSRGLCFSESFETLCFWWQQIMENVSLKLFSANGQVIFSTVCILPAKSQLMLSAVKPLLSMPDCENSQRFVSCIPPNAPRIGKYWVNTHRSALLQVIQSNLCWFTFMVVANETT